MELTPRLKTLAEQIPQGARLADIGTDHAYLPVWLLLQGKIRSAIAADLRSGPLDRAKNTAQQYCLSENISFRLCNGLADIGPEEVDTIAIAGMGGETIAAILEAAPWTKEEGKLLLLQPMTSFFELRHWLSQNGYSIEKETISREGNRLYSCLAVRGGTMPCLTAAELWVGRQNDDPLRLEYLSFMRKKIERARSGKAAAAVQDLTEIAFLDEVLRDICKMEGELMHEQRI